jgi:HSP20 family protein
MARKNKIQNSMLMEDELDSMFLDDMEGGDDFALEEVDAYQESPQQMQQQSPEAQPMAAQNSDDDGDEDEAQLAVDIFETPSELIIKARVAGVDRHELDVSVLNGIVIIQGSLLSTDTNDIVQYHLQECYWGKFYRKITLPVAINEDDEALEDCATLRDGVLTVRLIKERTEAARKIRIN